MFTLGKALSASVIVLALGLSACSSTTETKTTEVAANTNQAEQKYDKDDDIKCTYEATTGTRFKKKICTTKKQRKEMEASAQEQLRLRRNVRSTPIGL